MKINYDKKFLAQLKKNFFMAKALYECIKNEAEEIQRKVLAENEFYESEELAEMMETRGGSGTPKRILEPSETYMMDLNTDFQRYMDLTYAEYVKAGIDDPRGREYIPEAGQSQGLRFRSSRCSKSFRLTSCRKSSGSRHLC